MPIYNYFHNKKFNFKKVLKKINRWVDFGGKKISRDREAHHIIIKDQLTKKTYWGSKCMFQSKHFQNKVKTDRAERRNGHIHHYGGLNTPLSEHLIEIQISHLQSHQQPEPKSTFIEHSTHQHRIHKFKSIRGVRKS